MRRTVPKGWIYFAQITGTITAVISLGVFIYFFIDLKRLGGENMTNQEFAIVGILLAVLVYLLWKTIFSAIIIIRFVARANDEEIIANKYIIAALSLSLGGFFTPLIFTRMPNVVATSTIKPRVFLSKTIGLTMLVGFAITFITYITYMSVEANLSFSQLFQNADIKEYSTIVFCVSIVGVAIGAILTISFWNQTKASENISFSSWMKFISTFTLLIVSVELIFVAIMAIIRLIGAILDLAKALSGNNDAPIIKMIRVLFSLFRLIYTILYVGMLISLIFQTIHGIWNKNGVVTIKESKNIHWIEAKEQERLNKNNN